MKKFNPSAWAIEHPQLVIYMMIVIMLAGAFSYLRLGRTEDPEFLFRVMVVRTLWPGATASDTEQELTERIEKSLQGVAGVDIIKSVTRPGESLIFVQSREDLSAADGAAVWAKVRKKLDDLRPSLPPGIQGPAPNDDFGDVRVMIYGMAGDGFDMGELYRHAKRVERELRALPDVKRVDLLGVQSEKIYLEVAPGRAAALGITPAQIADALQRQNGVEAAGFVETATDRVRMNVSGPYADVAAIEATPLRVNGRQIRIGDIADVHRGFAEPPEPGMRVGGKPAIGIAVVMIPGGDVIGLGEAVQARLKTLQAELPLGIEFHRVADLPARVKSSIKLFLESLGEAILIVLAVSFLSLGWRTGLVVAGSIPLVLALTFIVMHQLDIDLQRISLGSLVIALGLLVDDAIIAAEMMVVKMEEGWDRFRAATFAYTSTAMPMLSGTLVTATGFLPIGFAKSSVGEYCFSIFAVVTIALVCSWVVAVLFTPYLGYLLLDPVKLAAKRRAHQDADIYGTRFYRWFRRLVEWCVDHRWSVIIASGVGLCFAMLLFATVIERQFFASSSTPQLMLDLHLPEGSSLKATTAETQRIEAVLKDDRNVESFTSFVGSGAPLFDLSTEQQLAADNFAQILVYTPDLKTRNALKQRLEDMFANNPDFPRLRLRIGVPGAGPPVGYPVQFRVSGGDKETLRGIAEEVAAIMRGHAELRDVNFDWNEKIKSLRVEIDQERARALGVTSQDVARTLQTWLGGTALTQLREKDELIDVVLRAPGAERNSLDGLAGLDLVTASGRHVPLGQVARWRPVIEEGTIWRRDRLPTITVRATMASGPVQAQTASAAISDELQPLLARLPAGYRIEVGGEVEDSNKGTLSISKLFPVTVLILVTLLMLQLQSFGRTAMVLLTAPLGMIGVPVALYLFNSPFGFVANLGVLALMGMIMRNSIILVDQIRQDEDSGKSRYEAIVGSTVRRFRPVVLTAAAAILAMLPLTQQVFWGPMAVAIMGGLLVATILTCLFLPALYAAWYRVRKSEPETMPKEFAMEGQIS